MTREQSPSSVARAVEVTVAVCGHNAAARLPACLGALARQKTSVAWEVVVIDNASTDATATVAHEWTGVLPLRVEREPRKGLIFARERAVLEARGRILAWVDDDNLVTDDYVDQAAAFFDRVPRCGLAGARVEPTFDDGVTPPPDFDQRFADALACTDRGPLERRLIPPHEDPPFGAGMVGRTELLRTILLRIGCRLTGRSGKSLTSGEDTEIGLIAHHMGWQLWHAPGLRLRHVMPASRLTDAYLHKLIAGGARAQAWLDELRGRAPRRSRLAHATEAARLELSAAKFAALKWARQDPKLAFWHDLYRGRAWGHWSLSRHNPWPGLQRKLAHHSSATAS